MIIDCISDLHGHYPELEGGDLLIVAGDLTDTDTEPEYTKIYRCLIGQNYRRIILIGGNHDNWLQKNGAPYPFPDNNDPVNRHVIYLCDSGTEFEYEVQMEHPASTDRVKIDVLMYERRKLKIWGSPWTKTFPGMNPHCKAFTVDTEEELAEKFALIPDDVDILITHSPRAGFGDKIVDDNLCLTSMPPKTAYKCVGSMSLAAKIGNLKNLKLHVCGHIHEGYGIEKPTEGYMPAFMEQNCFVSVNASHVNEHYEPVNKPIRVILL